MPLRPPLAYFGGKTLMAPAIVSAFPDHRHYVEPFAGSLAVLLAKPPSVFETVNDLDGDLVTFWRVLRERPAELIEAAYLTPHSRAEHRAAYDLGPDVDELERARRVWVQLTQGRAGVRRSTGWRHYQAARGTASMPRYLSGYVERMAPVVDRLHDVSLECLPALDLIERYGRHPDVLLYVDPPYLVRARTDVDRYVVEMRDEDGHRELLAALLACRASVVLSGYASQLYDDALAGWHRREIRTMTGQGGANSERVEVLWTNRSPGAELF